MRKNHAVRLVRDQHELETTSVGAAKATMGVVGHSVAVQSPDHRALRRSHRTAGTWRQVLISRRGGGSAMIVGRAVPILPGCGSVGAVREPPLRPGRPSDRTAGQGTVKEGFFPPPQGDQWKTATLGGESEGFPGIFIFPTGTTREAWDLAVGGHQRRNP
jgi:hypothetical protein